MSLKKKCLTSVLALSLTTLLSAQTAFAYSNVTLKNGMRGNDVYSLQKDLIKLGYMTVKPTGYYGSITKAAVLEMQGEYSLIRDGVAGKQTLGILDSLMGRKIVLSKSPDPEVILSELAKTEEIDAESSNAEAKVPDTAKTADAETATTVVEAKNTDAEEAGSEAEQKEEKVTVKASRGASRAAESIIDYARRFMGVKYVWGGTTPKGFDCSGFIKYVYGHFDVSLARNSRTQASNGTYIKRIDLLPGDLVFFDTDGGKDRINHVGIYIGDGKMIHASSNNKSVVISNITSGFYSQSYMTARRVLQ